MQIVEMSIGDVKPYEKNPRINDNAVEKVANSIKEFGFKSPIIIDNNNVIIAGHTRHKAAQKLGLAVVPCIVAKDLTEAQAKAYRLADNKTAEFSEWDFAMLHDELDDLADITDFEMQDFGFYVDESFSFDEIFEPQPTATKQEQPKAEPVEQQETFCQPQQNVPEEPFCRPQQNGTEEPEESTEETQPEETPEEVRFTVSVTLDSLEDAQKLAEALQNDGYTCEVNAA